jgi:hypothetical protein
MQITENQPLLTVNFSLIKTRLHIHGLYSSSVWGCVDPDVIFYYISLMLSAGVIPKTPSTSIHLILSVHQVSYAKA